MARTLTIDNADGFENGSYISINGTKVWEDGDSYPATFTITTGDIIKIRSNGFVIYGWGDQQVYFDDTLNITAGDITICGLDHAPGYNIATINYTEIPRKSVDLTTLPGWSSLSSGSHSITIVAKANGYRDSEPSAAVSVEKGAAMPVKGDLITIEGKQYRVLKTNDNVAEVLAMYYASTSQSFHNSRNSNAYADSSLDFYLTQSFYKSLSTTMQNAIVAKTFRQDSWYYGSNSSAIAKYNGTYQTTNNYTLSLMSTTFGAFISRKCYVLSCQDVIDYLEVMTSMGSADTTLTSENVWRMFWNQTTSPGRTHPWLRSARSNDSRYAFYVNANNGSLSSDFVDYNFAVRPAFQIDLSKIEWTKSATLISFKIGSKSYQAEEGMTWAEWVESSYNTDGYYIDGGSLDTPEGYIVMVTINSTIVDGHAYSINDGNSSGTGN